MDGTMEVTPDASFTLKDISISNRTSESDFDASQYKEKDLAKNGEDYYIDRFINLYRGQYNEDDFKVGDKIYQSEGAYLQAIISASQKTGSGLIHYLLMMVLIDMAGLGKYSYDFSWLTNLFGGDYDESYIGLIDLLAFAVASPKSFEAIPKLWILDIGGILSKIGTMIGDLLAMVSRTISGLLPLYTSYNMFETSDLDQSPLNAATYALSMKDETGNVIEEETGSIHDLFLGSNSKKTIEGAYTVQRNDEIVEGAKLYRETVEHDRSVYAKVSLEEGGENGSIDNIRLVLNGATYSKNAEYGGSSVESKNVDSDVTPDKSKEWNYDFPYYSGQNGKFFSKSSKQINESYYVKTSTQVSAGGGAGLYVRVKGTDSYIAAAEAGSDLAQYEDYYYAKVEKTEKTNVSKSYTFRNDTGAIYEIKASDIRTMMVIEKGKEVDFTGAYYGKNGSTSGYASYVSKFEHVSDFMEDWISSSNHNSYSTTDVYFVDELTGEKVVYYRYFIFDAYGDKYDMKDNGNSIKDDRYQEVDIDFNGLGIRNVITTDFSDARFYRYEYSEEEGYKAVGEDDGTGARLWTNPTKIIIYDPYDLTDFRAIGGTWSMMGTSSGEVGRRNYDAQVTVKDILANRVNVRFNTGTSRGSNGVGIAWNLDAIKGFKPMDGEKYYLEGYVGNVVFAEIEIEVVNASLEGADGATDTANTIKTELLKLAQRIKFDPYKESVENFIDKFYDVFMAEYSSTEKVNDNPLREKTYIYNDLVWTLDYTYTTYKDKDGNRIKAYDSLTDYDNAYINLKYRTYGKDANGENYKSNTAWNSLKISLLEVKNYTIDTVSAAIEGEGVVGSGVVRADRELIKARLMSLYPSMKESDATTRANTYSGMIDINPLNNSNPYETMEKISSFDVLLARLTAEGNEEVIDGWEIIPNSFEVERNKLGRTLAEYDSLDTSEQNYTVSYKITDATGNVQTVKVWVHIQASGITGTSDGLEGELYDAVTPYEQSTTGDKVTDVLNALNLKRETGIVYENTSEAESAIGEKVSLGANPTVEYVALVVPTEDGYEVKPYIYVKGENGLSYSIPIKKYDDSSLVDYSLGSRTGKASFVIDLEVGKQGFARTEMNEIITKVLLESAKTNSSYTSDKAKAKAYDVLYEQSDRLTRNEMTASYNDYRSRFPLIGETSAKAYVWEKVYDSYAEETSDLYSPVDALMLDVILLKQQLTWASLTYEGAKSNGYDLIYASGTVSTRKLSELVDEAQSKTPSSTTTERKAYAWDKWYDEYTRAVIGLPRTIDTRTVSKVAAVIVTETVPENITELGNANVSFKGVVDKNGQAEFFSKAVTWLDEDKIIASLRENVGIAGYLAYAELVLKDNVFGSQIVRGIPVQLSIIKVERLIYNTIGNELSERTSYRPEWSDEFIRLGVDPYDEESIDITLGWYFTQTSATSDNDAILLRTSTEAGATQSVISYFNRVWELATYFDENGREKVLWRYKNDSNNNGDRTDDGVGFDGKTNTEIEVLVRSYGYSENSASNKWQTWVTFDLANVVNAKDGVVLTEPSGEYRTYNFISDATISSIDGEAEFNGEKVAISKAYGKEYDYEMSIDPYKVDLSGEGTFSVVYTRNASKPVNDPERYSELKGTIDLSVAEMKNFYNRSYVDTEIVFGTTYNNKQTVKVRIYNSTIRRFTEITGIAYYNGDKLVDFDKVIASAYDDLTSIMPDKAVVTVVVDESVTEKVTLDVVWSNIDEYDYTGLAANGKRPTALALIGNRTFGYRTDEVTLKIAQEIITSIDEKDGVKLGDLPDAVTVDPYNSNGNAEQASGMSMDAIKAKYTEVLITSDVIFDGEVIQAGKQRKVSIKIDDGNIDYDAYNASGFAEATHEIYFNVGSTVVYGANGQNSFEVRTAYPVSATLLSRKIVSVVFKERTVVDGKEVIGDETELSGDIYKEVYLGDFASDDSPYAVYAQYGSGNQPVRLADGITIDELSRRSVEYTPGGGEYTVKAYIGAGSLRQEFDVVVRIEKAMLLGIVNTDEAGISAAGTYHGNEMLVYERNAGLDVYELKNLVIEPFVGFVNMGEFKTNAYVDYNGRKDYSSYGLPSEIEVLLDRKNGTETTKLSVIWDYSAVLSVMSINGGEYDEKETNTIVLAKVYKDVDEDGNPVNVQTARVSVSVTNRAIKHYEVSYDPKGAKGTYAAIDDLIYTKFNGGATSTYELLLDPYNLKNAMFESNNRINATSATYSEEITDESGNANATFTYFRYAKAICEGGYEITYMLTSDNYKIYDARTGYATVKSNLYTGRNVTVELTVGADVTDSEAARKGASDAYGLRVAPKTNGKDYVPSSTSEKVFRDAIDVRILDMTYETGKGLDKDAYYIDVYGIIESFDKTVNYDETVSGKTIIGKDNSKYAWGEGYNGTISNIVSHTFDTISYDGADANVNRYAIETVKGNGAGGVAVTLKKATGSGAGRQIGYGGGVGRLIVTFGSASEQATGGVQTFDVPVIYVERTVESVLFVTSAAEGTTAPFYNSSTNTFEFDPFVRYVNNPDGFAQDEATGNYEQGYLKYGQYGATLRFKETAIDKALNVTLKTSSYDLSEQVNTQYVGLTFSDSSITIKTSGGTFDVYGIVSNSGKDSELSRQRIPFKAKFKSRIAGVNTAVPHGTTADGEVVYYHKLAEESNEYYEIVNGFTANLFVDGVLTDKTVTLDNGDILTVKCLDKDKLEKALKVYDYIGKFNIGEEISRGVFKNRAGQVYYVYGKGTTTPVRFVYGKNATDYIGEVVVNGKKNKVTFILTSEEISGEVDGELYNNGVQMIFKMDATYGINYRGTGVKFLMKVPGFAAGRNERQEIVVKVSTKEQYIPFAIPTMKYGFNGKSAQADAYRIDMTNTVIEGVTVDIYGYAWLKYFESLIDAKSDGHHDYLVSNGKIYLRDTTWGSNADTSYGTMHMISYDTVTGRFTIESPYYFIEDGGIKMPDYVMIYAGSKALKDEFTAALSHFGGNVSDEFTAYGSFSEWLNAWMENGEKGGSLDSYYHYYRGAQTAEYEKYLVALWSGGNENKITVNFNDEERATTFKMSIDDQSVSLNFKVVPWLIAGTANSVVLFRSTEQYGPEES